MSSSIHIEAGHAGYFAHNDRSAPTVNSIFHDKDFPNYCSKSAKEAFADYRKITADRTAKYTARTGQKLNAKTITHLSAIVNLEAKHTSKHLKEVVEYLEKALDTKVFQVAIHRDEGHVKDEKNIRNFHAHIEFSGLDSNGNSIRKKLTKRFLSDLQTEVASMLQMKRGTNYAKEQKPRPKRMSTYDYKHMMSSIDQERERLSYNYREMQQRITALQEIDTARKKELHALNAEISKMKIESDQKSLKIAELQKIVAERTETALKATEAIKAIKDTQNDNSAVLDALETAEKRIGMIDGMIEEGATTQELYEVCKKMQYEPKTQAYKTAKTRASEAYRIRLNEQRSNKPTQNPSLRR